MEQEIVNFDQKSNYDKVAELTSIVCIEIKENPILVVSMIGGTITKLLSVLFSTYLILWI